MKNKEEIEKMTLLEFILFVDFMTTKEFCDWQGCPHPIAIGTTQQMADQFLQVDAIKHRLFVEKAKAERKKMAEATPQKIVYNTNIVTAITLVMFFGCVTIIFAIALLMENILPLWLSTIIGLFVGVSLLIFLGQSEKLDYFLTKLEVKFKK